jgi:hypothetical protein
MNEQWRKSTNERLGKKQKFVAAFGTIFEIVKETSKKLYI